MNPLPLNPCVSRQVLADAIGGHFGLFGYRAVRGEFFSLSLLGLTSGIAKVTGTIWNPTAALDPRGILAHGSAAWPVMKAPGSVTTR